MTINFRRPHFPVALPQRNNAGNTRVSKASLAKPQSVGWRIRATARPVVTTVSVEDPTPRVTDIALSEQTRAGSTAGEILQLKLMLDGLNSTTGVMVILDRAAPPGRTEAGERADAERLKLEALTTTLVTEDVLPLKLVSPPYCAVILCAPAASADVDSDATPPLKLKLPIGLVPSRKVTVPVGTPEFPDVTVAVSVMFWFRLAVLGTASKVVVVSAF
jgi:hypothetical protein